MAVGAVLAGIALVAGTRPALACSCAAPGSPASEVERHDAVFVGRAVEALDADGIEPRFQGSAVAYTFEVSAVYRGELATTQQVGTNGPGASCGYEFEVGRDYLVFAHTMQEAWRESARTVPAGELLTGYCTPTVPVEEVDLATLPPPGAPEPGEHRYLAAASLVERVLPGSADHRSPAEWAVVTAMVAIPLAIAVVVGVRTSRRRSRAAGVPR